MYLAYLDDSDTKQKPLKIQVMSGLIVDDKWFKSLSLNLRAIRDTLVPPEKLDAFEEFHACELYGGYGVFEGIEQSARFGAIKRILHLLGFAEASVVYGAVDIAKNKRQVYGSADVLDTAFRICLGKVNEWAKQRTGRLMAEVVQDEDAAVQKWLEQSVLLIVDDCEKKQRDMLQSSFRSLRHPAKSEASEYVRMSHFHDDIYFGDSRYSIGIQLADLCSYFISRHLQGDEEIKGFYDLIEPHIASGEIHPGGEQFKRETPLLMAFQEAFRGKEQRVPELRQSNEETDSDPTRQTESSSGGGEGAEGDKTKKAEA